MKALSLGQQRIKDVTEIAKSYIGVFWEPGKTCQCANFVRLVFGKAGINLPVANPPSDYSLLPAGEPIGRSYADSFAGDDVGRKISSVSGLAAGDIVMFMNTYGSYPHGVITHVGVMADSEYFVHRPTADRPVEKAAISGYWAGKFAEGRRPKAFDVRVMTAKAFAHDGKGRAYLDGREFKTAVFKGFANGGKIAFYANFTGGSLEDFSKGSGSIAIGDGDSKMRLFLGADGSWKWFAPGGVYIKDRSKVKVALQIFVDSGRYCAEYDLGDGKGLIRSDSISAQAEFKKTV